MKEIFAAIEQRKVFWFGHDTGMCWNGQPDLPIAVKIYFVRLILTCDIALKKINRFRVGYLLYKLLFFSYYIREMAGIRNGAGNLPVQ